MWCLDCEQNDIAMVEALNKGKGMKRSMIVGNTTGVVGGHKKTKSEGATPMGSNYIKGHIFNGTFLTFLNCFSKTTVKHQVSTNECTSSITN